MSSTVIRPADLPHGSLLRKKAKTNPILRPALAAYDELSESLLERTVLTSGDVVALVDALNEYRAVALPIFESGKNVPQENLRSTLMEEFFSWLFKDIFTALDLDVPRNVRIGKSVNSYVSLAFAPHSFKTVFSDPNPRIAKKDQDFAIGALFRLGFEAEGQNDRVESDILIPIVAIECKTYLAKNHLDMCAATAGRIKSAAPYCMYIVASEFLKMHPGVYPELSDISEIYVLCRAHNSERKRYRDSGEPPHSIQADLIVDLFERVLAHLRRIWWDPTSAIQSGRVISRPL